MTISPELLRHAVAAAAWAEESGWPTRQRDMEIAIDVYGRPAHHRRCLTAALDRALRRSGSDEGLTHRIVLCRLGLRFLEADDPSTDGRS